ncbi:aldose epimerase family protein [Arthrospiribacter ruber]|uniref:Aldose 1-epimerase n=1 Tax=Arthrospiribacter ruber TaxID=2487934 RepID=A0A951MCU5_9BACT|nr:aldose epimerase family protein [Arthrospiribacter ruber]MBW3466731.1 galactose mutarotase [Arthrospiribacter ruber]
MKKPTPFLPFFLLLFIIACQSKHENKDMENISFDIHVKKVQMGENEAMTYVLKNSKGMEVELTDFGATLTKISVPDAEGNIGNVMLTYNAVEDFYEDRYFFGALAGRYANRIAKGRFKLGGKEYQLTTNNGENHLHGGAKGFNRQFWSSEVIDGLENEIGVRMRYVSEDGEEGYPGNLVTTVDFILEKDNRLRISMKAETDQSTIVNLTHHGYFNLSNMTEDVLDHEVKMFAEHYTPVGEGLIPTGEIKSVKGTPYDFTDYKKIGKDIADTGAGYDQNFVVSKTHDSQLRKMAEVFHKGTGRLMTVYSNKPGVQFYTGNFLDGKQTTDGVTYTKHFGFCLEPQFFPNSPNVPDFPSPRLDPGDIYSHEIIYEFDILKNRS